METESLAQLIQLFAQLGAEAKWAFISYLVFKGGLAVLVAGTILLLAYWIIRAFRQSDEDTKAMRTIGEVLQVRWYERDAMVERIRELKAKA